MDDPTTTMHDLVAMMERVVTGKRRVVERVVTALAAGTHVLLEDVPGTGKTILARTLARAVDCSFGRVQGAPDLMPADVTGSNVWDPGTGGFRFVQGPVFSQVLLVDELNRTTPRTQAALLEAMEERSVTVDGTTHPLPAPHLVIATQNPLEHLGTFPLPESQLDRFGLALSMGYPSARDEVAVVTDQLTAHPIEAVTPVVGPAEVLALQSAVRTVHVAESVVGYCVELVRATRDRAVLGASPRASVQLVRLAQANALLHGRDHVLPDDGKALAVDVLAHRLRTADGGDQLQVVLDVLARTPVPV